MARNAYRAAFERLKAGVAEATCLDDAGALARATEEMDRFVASMISDRRKLRWIAEESPGCAAEIETLAGALELPRRVLDPVHDAGYARLWLASLGDEQVAMLHRVLADEASARASSRAMF